MVPAGTSSNSDTATAERAVRSMIEILMSAIGIDPATCVSHDRVGRAGVGY